MQCAKCCSQMQEDRYLRALGCEVELVSKNGVRGEKINVFYCEKCGHIELSRDKNSRY